MSLKKCQKMSTCKDITILFFYIVEKRRKISAKQINLMGKYWIGPIIL